MNRYYAKKQKKHRKLIVRHIKHIYYRIRHYGAAIFNTPRRWWDSFWGSFVYKKSPMFRDTMDYETFAAEFGRYGEFQLWRKARKCLGRDTLWLTNVYLPKKDGATCEIDLVAVSKRGVLVFESKNYTGWIFGDFQNPDWYQVIRKDVNKKPRKYSFFNPVMQNGMHCRVLWQTVEIAPEKVKSFIVFSNHCRLKDIRNEDNRSVVCRQFQLGRKIRKLKRSVLTADEVQNVYQKLLPYTKVTWQNKQQHIQDVYQRK